MPLIFVYANTVGPDLGTASLTTVAIWLLCRREQPFLAGLLLGAAALFRSHALLSGIALIVAYYCYYRRNWAIVAGFFLVFSAQPIVTLISGTVRFHQHNYFNIYKAIHPINWWDPPRQIHETLPQ